MAIGTVKWFNSAKGYGFVCPEIGGQDVFAHFSAICMDGYKYLKAGQAVEFSIHDGPKGPHAIDIRVTEDVEDDQGQPTPYKTHEAIEEPA